MYHIIINPKSSSGKGIRYWWAVKNELDKKKIIYTANFTRYSGHASEIAAQISKKPGIKNVIVLGGDGTINEALNGFNSLNKILLGYIPSGSSNDLARSLKIPSDPIKALNNILNPSKFKYLDYGQITFVNSDLPPRKFACSSGMGYDASVCLEVQSSPLKKKFNKYGVGKFIYLFIAIKQLITSKNVRGTLIIDGKKKDTFHNILLVSSMIHKYEGGGLRITPNANPTDGKLSVCLVHGMSRLKILFLLPTLIIGKHIFFKGVKTFQCNSLEIITDQDLAIHTDGEVPHIYSHIKVTCFHQKIRMIL